MLVHRRSRSRCAVVGFLPFNLRPGRRALAWMGDSGSQLIGFTLAALGLASSYTVASSTRRDARAAGARARRADPRHDARHDRAAARRRPDLAGRARPQLAPARLARRLRDAAPSCCSRSISAALGATSLAYEAFGNGRLAAIGVLVTFALLVQFGSFLADVDRAHEPGAPSIVYTRRLAEVVVDGALIAASFLAAYLLRFNGIGTPNQRHYFLLTLPVLLFCRYVALLAARHVRRRLALRELARRAARRVPPSASPGSSRSASSCSRRAQLGDFSRSVFVIDALICSVGDRARAVRRARDRPRRSSSRGSGEGRRVLIVGAGRTGRSLLRELRETPGERVVGFVDDDPRAARPAAERRPGRRRRRRDRARCSSGSQPDVVFVTIPDAPQERLDADRAGLRRARDRLPLRPARGRRRPARRSSAPSRRDAAPKPARCSTACSRPTRSLVAYLVLLTLYAWQTTRIRRPWLFTDELKWALLSRAIAHTGRPELRLSTTPFGSLYAYFLAPAWWLGATGPGYAAAKYLNAAVMTASLFPAYALARLFLPRRRRSLAAVATAAIPSLALHRRADARVARVLLVDAGALARRARAAAPARRSVAVGRGRRAAVAPLVRAQLQVLIAGGAVAAAIVRRDERARARD